MTYDEEEPAEEEQEEQEEEEEEVTCNVCEYDVLESDIAISFEEKESGDDKDICKACLAQIFKRAQAKDLLPTSETKVVEKIIEKPVEKIVYKTIDKNGNEVGFNHRTKFD